MNTATIRRAVKDVMNASNLKVLVQASRTANSKQAVRYYALRLHPDTFPVDLDNKVREVAIEAYSHLMSLAHSAPKDMPPMSRCIATRHGEHDLSTQAVVGDLATVYMSNSTMKGRHSPSVLKASRTVTDNDLLEQEALVLERFAVSSTTMQYRAFVPELLDTAWVESSSGRMRANILKRCEGFVSLKDVAAAYPGGVPALDAIWMWRRLLVALGYSHDNGVVHGAVLPQNVLIHPSLHGLVLIDWCYASVDNGGYPAIKALVTTQRAWYPKEVLDKQPPSGATDIALAARTMIWLLGSDPLRDVLPSSVLRPLRAFFRGCLAEKQSMRPQNAWVLLQEFDELLESMGSPYYPRRFRPFALPTVG